MCLVGFFFNQDTHLSEIFLLFLFHLTFLSNMLVCFVMSSVGIDMCSTPSHVYKGAFGLSFSMGGLGSALATSEILPLCVCNKVTFDLYDENC